ncbi:MAG: ATPase, T2SS/T4P/T4SS family [Candidatus Altiarchaeota archaeon]
MEGDQKTDNNPNEGEGGQTQNQEGLNQGEQKPDEKRSDKGQQQERSPEQQDQKQKDKKEESEQPKSTEEKEKTESEKKESIPSPGGVKVKIEEELTFDKPKKKKEKILDEYDIQCEGVTTGVRIVQEGYTPKYKLVLPEVGIATAGLLDDIKERLITSVEMTTSDILDPKLLLALKDEFKKSAEELIKSELPHLKDDVKDHFILNLVHELLGLGEIEFFLDDPNLEEIVINSAKEPVRVYQKKFGWLLTNVNLVSESQIANYASTIARRIGREISTLNPLLDAHLMSKDRANAILSPISSKGNTVTIRKFARDPWTCTDFIKNHTASDETLALIWLVIQYEMNMILSGGTGSGKTSFLNICMPFMPPNNRIISIEDTRELQLPDFLYWCPLTTREPNPEGKGEVSMLDLLINCLRMRPDRIIMGEIRKKREAEVLFEAMHTGHSVYGTLHADTCAQTITRFTNPPIEIPHSMLDSVHLNVVMFRDRRRGIRRTYEVGEFIMDEEHMEKEGRIKYKANVMYAWNARTDTIDKVNEPTHLFAELERHTGLNQQEIREEIEMKKKILNYMVDRNIRCIDEVGKILSRYYLDRQTVLDTVNENKDPKYMLELIEDDRKKTEA